MYSFWGLCYHLAMPLPSLSRADTNPLTASPWFVQDLKEIHFFPECLFFGLLKQWTMHAQITLNNSVSERHHKQLLLNNVQYECYVIKATYCI